MQLELKITADSAAEFQSTLIALGSIYAATQPTATAAAPVVETDKPKATRNTAKAKEETPKAAEPEKPAPVPEPEKPKEADPFADDEPEAKPMTYEEFRAVILPQMQANDKFRDALSAKIVDEYGKMSKIPADKFAHYIEFANTFKA